MEAASETIQKKLYFVNQNLVEQHSKLNHDIQTRIPLENLSLMGELFLNKFIANLRKNIYSSGFFF